MKHLYLSLFCLCVLHATVSAHVVDEFVQAAQLTLASNGIAIELRLTPGVELADRAFAMIDRDGNGKISPAEEEAYARRIMHDVTLEVDQQRMALTLKGAQFPSKSDMKAGVGVIRLNLWADASLRNAGEHQTLFRNNHLPQLSTYLANVLVPTTEGIRITGQQRDVLQQELQVNLRVNSADAPVPLQIAPVARSLWPKILMSITGLALVISIWLALRFAAPKQIPS
jgi:hypothetical protein